MNFSEQWRELWPIGSIFSAPKLIPAPSPQLSPLLFNPSSFPIPLLSDRSLSVSTPPSPSPSSLLSYLRCHSSPSSLLLFFPSGDNSHSIAYLSVSFRDPQRPQVGELFFQTDGFKHPFHRISSISVVPVVPALDWCCPEDNSDAAVEGFLIATTLYSVNWFRIEIRALDSGAQRPVLVPVAKQGFGISVVHACWNPHFQEESAVLLENGDLCWFNLSTRRGGRVTVMVDADDPGEWLGCVFGGQPWILIVGCSKAVLVVDLRVEKATKPRVLAKAGLEGSVDDRILSFCKAGFSDFHVSVVTQTRLLLFDMKQLSMAPLLMWNHFLDHPSHVSMFRLSELGPSEKHQWALESGFATIVGSFRNDSFSLFCYAPSESQGVIGNTSFDAWGLPSGLALSGKQCGFGDELFKELLASEQLPDGMEWQEMRDRVAGFFILPSDIFKVESRDDGVSGFNLIRLMTSGKLEMQSYNASSDLSSYSSASRNNDLVEIKDSSSCCKSSEGIEVSTRYSFLKLQNFHLCLNGDLSNTSSVHEPRLNKKVPDQLDIKKDVSTCSQPVASQEALDVRTICTNESALSNQLTCNGNSDNPRAVKKEPSTMDDHFESSREVGLEILDMGSDQLEIELVTKVFQPDEDKICKCLKRQLSKWLEGSEPSEDFSSWLK
ncbi:putative TATA box-binding protein-associated factor RNA polymerase I subunit C [Dioscorea sansibarensis]